MTKIKIDEKQKKKDMLDKNKEIFDFLREVGGIFYLVDMAKFFEIKTDTLRYRLKRIEEIGFIDITNDEYGSTERSVIRLTRKGWYNLGYPSRGLVKINEENIQRAFLKANVYKKFIIIKKYIVYDPESNTITRDYKFKSVNELNEMFFDSIESMIEKKTHEQHIYDYYKKVDLKEFTKKYKNKIVVYNQNLNTRSKNRRIKICFYKTKLDIYEITEFCDMLLGIIEMAFSIDDEKQYYCEQFYFDISLSVVSYYPLYNKNELLTPLQNKKRNYHYYAKFSSRGMYNYFKQHYKYINFFEVSNNEFKLIKY